MAVIETEVQNPEVKPKAPAEVTTRDVLHRAADLLEEFGWCRFVQAQNEKGEQVDITDSEVVEFCMVGAYWRAAIDLDASCPDLSGLGGRDARWNNEPERTKEEVVAWLRESAERA
jgi:hypothetical protein